MPIMYVCEPCQDNCPENCGHNNRDAIRVLSDGTWVCRDCFDNGDMDGVKWSDLPQPPEYKPAVSTAR
jgi:hypothetical protein